MKQKIGMLIEEKIVRLAKRKAAEESRPLSDLIQDALEQYLRKGAATAERTGDGVSSVLRTTDEDTPGATSLRARRRHVECMNLEDVRPVLLARCFRYFGFNP